MKRTLYCRNTRCCWTRRFKKKQKTEFALPADSSRLSEGLSGQIRRPDVCGCEREQGRNDRVSVSLRRGAVLQLLHIFLPTVLNETCACCYFHVENNLMKAITGFLPRFGTYRSVIRSIDEYTLVFRARSVHDG